MIARNASCWAWLRSPHISPARWNATGERVAYLFVFLGVVSAVAHAGVAGRLVRRIGERRTALAGLASVAGGLVTAALAPSWPVLLVGLGLLALGQGLASPAVSSLISRQGGAAEQGRVLGIFQSLSALARAAGPVAGGVALAHVGLAAPFLSRERRFSSFAPIVFYCDKTKSQSSQHSQS